MTDIWLVRHGEAAAAFDQEIDPGLSPLGHEQAEAASQQLSTIVPEDAQLLSSPKQRAIADRRSLCGDSGSGVAPRCAFHRATLSGGLGAAFRVAATGSGLQLVRLTHGRS